MSTPSNISSPTSIPSSDSTTPSTPPSLSPSAASSPSLSIEPPSSSPQSNTIPSSSSSGLPQSMSSNSSPSSPPVSSPVSQTTTTMPSLPVSSSFSTSPSASTSTTSTTSSTSTSSSTSPTSSTSSTSTSSSTSSTSSTSTTTTSSSPSSTSETSTSPTSTSTSAPPPPTTTTTTTTTPSSSPRPPPSSSSNVSQEPLTIISTFHSTVYITTTNSQGQTIQSAPSQITTTSTSTNADGVPSTVTQIIVNPTLSSGDGPQNSASAFFRNKGAVAGVFIVVGLAATSIVIFLIFWFRRRRRNKRIEHETEVEATLAAHGYRRTFVDGDDNDPPSSHMSATLSQGPSAGRNSSADISMRLSSPNMAMAGMALPATVGIHNDSDGQEEAANNPAFNPYHDFGVTRAPVQSSGPPPEYSRKLADVGPQPVTGRGVSSGHMPTDSSGSSEPLLGAGRSSEDTTPAISPPARNPLRIMNKMMFLTRSVSRKTKPDPSDEIPPSDEFEYEPYPRQTLEVRNNPD